MSRRRSSVLDDEKRHLILALLTSGCSRRMAARYVGCAPSTITRTAAREPKFAEQIAQAEGNCLLEALRNLRRAAQEGRYWRASAWVLERRFPDEFGYRKPEILTKEAVAEVLDLLAQIALRGMSKKKYRQVMRQLSAMIDLNRPDLEEKETGEA